MSKRNYFNEIILELDKLERFSPKYKAELRLLSKKIRKDLWDNNDAKLFVLLRVANKSIENKYPDRNICTYELLEDYVDAIKMLGAICIPKLNVDYYERLADDIQLENARVIIEDDWENINSSIDSQKSFLEIFDDIFINSIDKHSDIFFYPLKKNRYSV